MVSSPIIGSLIGAVWLGNLTDKFGRKAMYVIDLLAFVIFAALTALSKNAWQLIAFRFLLGVGIGADYPISATLVAEFSSRYHRGLHGTFLAAMWFVGAVAAYIGGLLCLPFGDQAWRYMFIVGAIFALIILSIATRGCSAAARRRLSRHRSRATALAGIWHESTRALYPGRTAD